MVTGKNDILVKVDGYTRVCLTIISVLLAVLILGLWTDAVPTAGCAKASDGSDPRVFGDSAAQRQELAKLQKQTVEKLDELISLLKSGEAKVQVIQAAEKPAGENRAAPKEE